MSKVSVLDLTVAQVERIERAEGLPMSRWREAPSVASLFARILSEVNGDDIERYRAMTMRALIDMVTLDDEDTLPNG